MADQGPVGLERIIKAFGYSMAGFRAAFAHEAAFRQELALALILVPAGYLLGENGIERALLIGSVLPILVVELLNSALEAVVDRVGEERHELSGRAKDLGSAAVFMAFIVAGAVWALVLIGN